MRPSALAWRHESSGSRDARTRTDQLLRRRWSADGLRPMRASVAMKEIARDGHSAELSMLCAREETLGSVGLIR